MKKEVLIGTSELSPKEFSHFLDNLENYVNSEFDMQLPISDYYGLCMGADNSEAINR